MSGGLSADNVGPPAPAPRPRKRRRWRRVLLGLFILVCGRAIGAAGVTVLTRHATRVRMLSVMGHPERAPGMIVEKMRKDLGLSPQQAQQIEAILTRRMGEVERIRDETRPRIDEQLTLMDREIVQVLDKNQERRYREGIKELERARHERPPGPRRGREHGPPPPPGARGER